jgi:signal transduction histidine kinase
LVVRWRLAEVKRLERLQAFEGLARERERIARDMHDDLGAGLTRLALLGQRVAGEADAAPPRPEVQRLTTEASNLVDNLSELIWATDAKYDDLPALLFFLREHAALYLADAHLVACLDFPESAPALAIPGALRRDLLLAMKEALHNAVRHARATEITVGCRIHPGEPGEPAALELTVADNGCGFEPPGDSRAGSPPQSGTGFQPVGEGRQEVVPHAPTQPNRSPLKGTGLAGLRTRLARHGGSMDLRTAPGQGTTLSLRVPLKDHGVQAH